MKVTIKGIITENKEDLFIDKVVKSLLSDTTYRINHKFMGEIVCEVKYPMGNDPMFGGTIYVYDKVKIKEILREFNQMYNNHEEMIQFGPSFYNDYMGVHYGLTDITVISKIGVTYYITLFTRILDELDNYQYTPINESDDKMHKYLTKVSEYLKKPYFYDLLHTYGIENKDGIWEKIFSKIYKGEKIFITHHRDTGEINREVDGKRLYYEDEDEGERFWSEYTYDDMGRKIKRISDTGYWEEWEYDDDYEYTYYNNSHNKWHKRTFDENGKEISSETYTGYWEKKEYDSSGDLIYYENSDGDWVKQEVDSEGNVKYREDNKGNITDNRWKYNDNINESINDKQEKFYDKVVEFLIKDTDYSVYNTDYGPYVDITFPMYDEYSYTYTITEINDWIIYKNNWDVGTSDYRYLNNTYGLSNEEIQHVLNKYISILSPIIYKKMDQIDTRY